MITNVICVFDIESCSKDKNKTQILQLSAVIIDSRKLTIKDKGIFNSYVKHITDEKECEKLGIDSIQQEALDVNGIKLEDLQDAPVIADVWQSFTDFIYRFNVSKKQWTAPIRCGYNITNFDNPIVDRMCKLYSPWDSKWASQTLFHPFVVYDLIHDVSRFTESMRINNSNSISLDSVREWMGIDKDGAHNALNDVFVCAFMMIKLLKLYRNFSRKVVFENSFTEENKAIAKLME